MSNVAYTIPNLIQGISQQPDAQRDPSQGEIQINGMSSIAEGLRKRDSAARWRKSAIRRLAMRSSIRSSAMQQRNTWLLFARTPSAYLT